MRIRILPTVILLWYFCCYPSDQAQSSERGFIRIDPEHPQTVQYDNGERFFPMGETAYYLLGQSKNTIMRYIDSRRTRKFNFIRIGAVGDGHWPFGGTPEKPVFTSINENAMQKLDWLFDYSARKGMNIELIIWTYGAKGGNKMWGNSRYENFWIDTLVNRYKNRKNLFMYTVTNEFERYPDDVYSFSSSDVEWAKNVAKRIRSIDPVHMIGAHPSHWTSQIPPHSKFNTYNGITQKLPQVVWPLWENSAINVYNVQNNGGVQKTYWGRCSNSRSGCAVYEPTEWQGMNYPVTWTRAGWDFEGAGMEDSISEDWSHGRPVINTEFGYQYESGAEASDPSFNTRQAHSPKTIRKKAWKIVTAGGYFAAGFVHTAVHFNPAKLDDWRPQQLEVLYDFFTRKTGYWKMSPHLELVADHNSCLALPGTEYVAYFPRGGTNKLTLQAGYYSFEWLNPETGIYYHKGTIPVFEGDHMFTPPDNTGADWVLHLKANPGPVPTCETCHLRQ